MENNNIPEYVIPEYVDEEGMAAAIRSALCWQDETLGTTGDWFKTPFSNEERLDAFLENEHPETTAPIIEYLKVSGKYDEDYPAGLKQMYLRLKGELPRLFQYMEGRIEKGYRGNLLPPKLSEEYQWVNYGTISKK